jgi:hypothetical protein
MMTMKLLCSLTEWSKKLGSQKFIYYLHDDSSSYERREWLEGQGITLTDVAWENLGRPFYEIGLECEVDDNGKVTILRVK